MDIMIKAAENTTDIAALYLDELAQFIEEDCDTNVKTIQQELKQGEKGGWIEIITLSLSSISVLLATLAYFQSKRPTLSLEINNGEIKYTLNNVSPQKTQEIYEQLNSTNESNKIEVIVSVLEE